MTTTTNINLNCIREKNIFDENTKHTNKTHRKDFYSYLKQKGLLNGTIKSSIKKWQGRQDFCNSTPKLLTPKQKYRNLRCEIPLGNSLTNHFFDRAQKLYPRRKNWEIPEPTTQKIDLGWETTTINHGRYSSRCYYNRFTYPIYVTSYGIILSPKKLRFRIETTSKIIKAPRGYEWQRDFNGIKLVKTDYTKADYHPTASELITGSILDITRKLRGNYKTRQEEVRKARREEKRFKETMKKASREGLAICIADSMRAGNCRGGTESWARQHKLDPTNHYTPKELLSIANGDTHRVMLVINCGLRRHKREMELGVCELRDHE